MFIGLNPSTADEVDNDPTVRRCVDYAKRWGLGAVCVVNLFAYRATKPAAMKVYATPIGANNDPWLRKLAKDAEMIVAAWGVNGTHLKRDKVVREMFAGKLSCLKTTRNGHPGHPLYLKKSLKPVPFI